MDPASFLAQFLQPPVVGFFLGLGVGLPLGALCGSHFFSFLSEGRRLKRADREAERKRREDAKQRRLESCRKRHEEEAKHHAEVAQRRLESCRKRHEEEARRAFIAERIERSVYTNADGYITDTAGRVYCADCFERNRLVVVCATETGFLCPACGKEL